MEVRDKYCVMQIITLNIRVEQKSNSEAATSRDESHHVQETSKAVQLKRGSCTHVAKISFYPFSAAIDPGCVVS